MNIRSVKMSVLIQLSGSCYSTKTYGERVGLNVGLKVGLSDGLNVGASVLFQEKVIMNKHEYEI